MKRKKSKHLEYKERKALSSKLPYSYSNIKISKSTYSLDKNTILPIDALTTRVQLNPSSYRKKLMDDEKIKRR
jgi:hypothetical protein